jgi:hypothetical protein
LIINLGGKGRREDAIELFGSKYSTLTMIITLPQVIPDGVPDGQLIVDPSPIVGLRF